MAKEVHSAFRTIDFIGVRIDLLTKEDMFQAHEWILENCSGEFLTSAVGPLHSMFFATFYFELADDAMAFKCAWA